MDGRTEHQPATPEVQARVRESFEVERMIGIGDITDAKSIAAFALLLLGHHET